MFYRRIYYHWPLYKADLSGVGPLICRCFSTVNTTELQDLQLVESVDVKEWWIWMADCYRQINPLCCSRVNCNAFRCKEQAFGLCGSRQGWDDLRVKHWNMYTTICKIDDQCKFDAWGRALKAGVLGQPRGMGWGGRWEWGSGWEGHMYTHGWFMLMYGKNHHNIVK